MGSAVDPKPIMRNLAELLRKLCSIETEALNASYSSRYHNLPFLGGSGKNSLRFMRGLDRLPESYTLAALISIRIRSTGEMPEAVRELIPRLRDGRFSSAVREHAKLWGGVS